MSNSALTVVQLPVLRGLGNTVQTAQTQRPDPGGGWAADTPLPPKNITEGLCEGLEPGDPSWGVLGPQHLPGQDLPVCICIHGVNRPFQMHFGFNVACVCSHLFLSFLLNCFVFSLLTFL